MNCGDIVAASSTAEDEHPARFGRSQRPVSAASVYIGERGWKFSCKFRQRIDLSPTDSSQSPLATTCLRLFRPTRFGRVFTMRTHVIYKPMNKMVEMHTVVGGHRLLKSRRLLVNSWAICHLKSLLLSPSLKDVQEAF